MTHIPRRRQNIWHSALAVSLVAVGVSVVAGAQFSRVPSGARIATPGDFDGRFNFCRLVYQSSLNGQGGRWTTDYPNADINMSIRLSELTRINVSFDARRYPNHLLVRPTDDVLFQCPFLMVAAPGAVHFDKTDAARLRTFLLKGGFLWADDFWGAYQWDQWQAEIQKVLPPADYPIVDLPMSHPLLTAQFVVTEIPQIPNIGYFRRSGGDTSERGLDSAVPRARIITDRAGRVMVLMTHNTDIADAWEREGDDENYFLAFSPRGYALGINVIVHAMTH